MSEFKCRVCHLDAYGHQLYGMLHGVHDFEPCELKLIEYTPAALHRAAFAEQAAELQRVATATEAQIAELQARGTELVLENRRLRARAEAAEITLAGAHETFGKTYRRAVDLEARNAMLHRQLAIWAGHHFARKAKLAAAWKRLAKKERGISNALTRLDP